MSVFYVNDKSDLYVSANNSITIKPIESTSLVIFDAVTIHRDGRVDVNPKYTTDEAAKKFWEAVVQISPEIFQKGI